MASPALHPVGERRPVQWNRTDVEFSYDALGRAFKWAELQKGRRIFLCGHGEHHFEDGYTMVPPGTSVNFYQTYGMSLQSPWVNQIIRGLADDHWLKPERTFRGGQLCPNLTLFADDPEELVTAEQALEARAKSFPQANSAEYLFNANQFTNTRIMEFTDPAGVTGQRNVLNLEEIFAKLPGHQFEWLCCQVIKWKHKVMPEDEGYHMPATVPERAFKVPAANRDPAIMAATEIRNMSLRRYEQRAQGAKIEPMKGHQEGAGVRTATPSALTADLRTRMGGPGLDFGKKEMDEVRFRTWNERTEQRLKENKKRVEQGISDILRQPQISLEDSVARLRYLRMALRQAEELLKLIGG